MFILAESDWYTLIFKRERLVKICGDFSFVLTRSLDLDLGRPFPTAWKNFFFFSTWSTIIHDVPNSFPQNSTMAQAITKKCILTLKNKILIIMWNTIFFFLKKEIGHEWRLLVWWVPVIDHSPSDTLKRIRSVNRCVRHLRDRATALGRG
jgi:hypothetical protein